MEGSDAGAEGFRDEEDADTDGVSIGVPGVAVFAFFFGARLVSLVRFFGGMVGSTGSKISHWQRTGAILEVEYGV